MGRIRKIGSAYLQLFTNLISIFNVYTKLVIQLQKWNATVLLRKSGRLASQYAADDKLDKVLENPQVIKNRGTSCVGVRKTGTTLIHVSTVMGTL